MTTQLFETPPIAFGTSLALELVPGRTYESPAAAIAGETIAIVTSSPDFSDTTLVLLAPDGSLVVGSDDDNFFFAGFEWVA